MNTNFLPNKNKLEELENRLAEAEETIEAIKYNKVDALVISTEKGEQVYRLKNTESLYGILIEKINEGAVTLSSEGTIVFSNKKFADLLKVPIETVVGSSIFKWLSISDLNEFTNYFHNFSESTLELNVLCGDGLHVPVSLRMSELRFDQNFDPEILLIATDLTEVKKSQEIFEAEKLARSVIEQTPEAIIVCDTELKIIRASTGAEKLANISLLNESFSSHFLLEDSDKNTLSLKDIVSGLLPFQSDVLFKRRDNQLFNLDFNVGMLSGQNKIQGYIITLTNITRHVQAEEKINASLKEKTTLLKEIHHRVKNNLQIVSSLLNIQASYIKDPGIKAIFDECQQRISSMALIHQKLYQSKSFSEINIIDYIKDMAGFLCRTYSFNSRQLKCNFEIDDFPLSVDTAVPIGLILNELITNCFKHAKMDPVKGEIVISLNKDDGNNICISVKDNGVGFPEGLEIKKSDTLGLQLVHTLAEQVNGKIDLIRGDGTEFRITVPSTEIILSQ